MKQQSNTLSLVGLILGIIGLVIAFVPCIGWLGSPLAVIGLILSIIGYRRDKEIGASTGMAIGGIITSALAILITIAYLLFWGKIADTATVEINSCEEALPKFEEALTTIEEIEKAKETNADLDMSVLSKTIKAATTIGTMSSTIEKLDCLSDPDFKAKYDELVARQAKLKDNN